MGGVRRMGDIVMIRLSDMDSNIYLIGDTVIDSGTGFNFTRLYQVMKMLKLKLMDVNRIINTHAHFDHIGGNGYFIDAEVAIHEKDAEVVEKADNTMSYADFYDGKLRPRKVDNRLKEGDRITAGSMELEVMHTPGHTPGSICLYDSRSGTLFSGDTVFSDGVGRTDMPGGDSRQLQSSLEKLSQVHVKRLLPGHGDALVLDEPKPLGDVMSSPAEPPDEDAI